MAAQNTAAPPTAQAQARASSGSRTDAATQRRTQTTRRGAQTRGVQQSGAVTPQGTSNRSGNASQANRAPVASANRSVGVLGDSDGDGTLDRFAIGPDSAALPGITVLHNTLGIATGTAIQVRLQQTVDSGQAHNGDTLQGVLASPLGKVPSGAPVTLTVVAAAAAGQLSSSGVLSLQVVSVNGEQVLSQVITAEGQEGTKTLADEAPARGTEAVFTSDQPITLPAA